MNHTHHAPTSCPVCKTRVDTATLVSSKSGRRAKAKPGVVTMCLYCGAWLRYTRTMQLRLLTVREYDRAPPEDRKLFARMEQARQHVMRERAAKETLQ